MLELYNSNLALYIKACDTIDYIKRKGKTMPYTSYNGHMFSFLRKDGVLGIRFSDSEREQFELKFGNKEFKNNGAVLKNYVTIPQPLLENTLKLADYLAMGFAYVSTLKPK